MSQSNIWADLDQPTRDAVPDVSVVIVSWNVRDLLIQCLTALFSPPVSSTLRLEVFVIDNASKDGSADAARSFEQVRVIEAGSNLGYGRANNLGLAQANGRHLLILNPDTVPQPGCLEAMISFLEGERTAGIVSPRLLSGDGSVQTSAFHFPTLLMSIFDLFPLPEFVPGRLRARIYSSSLNGRYLREARARRPFRIDHPLGACMMLRREAYEQAGGFDPAIHMYTEEIDLAMRYANAGWECWQVPTARVVHLGGKSTGQMPNKMFIELWRSRLYLYSRHYSGRDRVLLKALLFISQILDACRTIAALLLHRTPGAHGRKRLLRAGILIRLALRS